VISPALPFRTRLPRGLVCFLAAAAVWLPALHLLYRPRLDHWRAASGVASRARALAARHLALWTDPALREGEIARMRVSNAEWDFMGRTFLVLSLANLSLREPSAAQGHLAIMDRIVEETLRIEREKSMHHFLMPYSRSGPYLERPERSLFVDGEIGLMLGARLLVGEKQEFRGLLAERIAAVYDGFLRSPALLLESYPNECWIFDHCAALAAIRIGDLILGQDHEEFTGRWLRNAREKLTDRTTGLLVSSLTRDGRPLDGPEGSTIWMASHCLALVDPEFSRDQYARARNELARNVLGFAYAREWPRSWKGPTDIDSGPTIPLLEANAGSSGMAFLGAATFGDAEYLSGLLTTLNFAAFPIEEGGQLRYGASNQVGDSALLYSMVLGPLWKKVREGRRP
jgi:hypothetical protein